MAIEDACNPEDDAQTIGVGVGLGSCGTLGDGQRAGSVEMNETTEMPIEAGRHTLQIRSGRNSSRTRTFEAAENRAVSFRCTGKSPLPIFLASFVGPSLAPSSAVKPMIERCDDDIAGPAQS